MINTGLLLQRPFESDYSAYRRFLIANHTQSLQSIRIGLAEKVPIASRTSCSLPDLARQWEQKYCNQYQIPYKPPVSTCTRRAHLRSCPTCASLGYHSYLFQYPWCRYCPIHQKPLVQACPTCRMLWPIVSELQTTRAKCSMCGIHYDIKKLSKMLSSTNNEGFEVLSRLDQALKGTRTQQVQLIGVPWSLEGDLWRSTNRPESLDWVSLVYPRPQQWEKVCELIGAPLQPVCIRRYTISERVTEPEPLSYYSLTPSRKCVEQAIRRRILRGLTPLIKRLAPPYLSSGVAQHIGYLKTLNDSDIFRMCFNTWRVLFSLGHHQHPLPYASYFCKPEFVSPPDQPNRVWEMNVSGMRFKIPETLSMWLYRTEFWRGYLHLLGHLKTLNDALKKGYTWRDYYNRLPEDAIASRYSPIGLSITPNESDMITVVLPQRHAKITKKSLFCSLTMNSRIHGFTTLEGETDLQRAPLNTRIYETLAYDKAYDELIREKACRVFDDMYRLPCSDRFRQGQ